METPQEQLSKSSQAVDEKVLRGEVEKVIYRNEDNGYTVFKFNLSDGSSITATATVPGIKRGLPGIIRGHFEHHRKYGRQFRAYSFTPIKPTTKDAIKSYLENSRIKGIGPKTIEKIIAKYGENALEAIEKDPKAVAKIPGVGKQKANLLHEALIKVAEERESLRFLLENDISPLLAGRIYKLYGAKTVEIVSQDPYRLAKDLKGVGFATADSIALKLGLEMDSPKRLKAGCIYALEKSAETDGHCYLPFDALIKKAQMLLDIENIDLMPYIRELVKEGGIIDKDGALYLPKLAKAENYVGRFVANRCRKFSKPKIPPETIDAAIKDMESQLSLRLSQNQKDAVCAAAQYPLVVITGGPGSGKTTIIRAISSAYRSAGLRVLLTAPTGRAAQRMAQLCDMPAYTIHRLLKFDPVSRKFKHGPNNHLIADLIIVDESSMIDISLAASLFSAISEETTLILVGDKDQLPSVGPGTVLTDILSVAQVKSISLTQIFRRDENSIITSIAHSVNSGILPKIPIPQSGVTADAYFIPKNTPEEIINVVKALVGGQISQKRGIDPDDILVITPSNKGPLGTVTLNKELQDFLNPKSSLGDEDEIVYGDTVFRLKDKVCQRVN
ncbi:MAG: hypothetical protein D6808_06520, partial [Candidatus Dadabacteria bacterium]